MRLTGAGGLLAAALLVTMLCGCASGHAQSKPGDPLAGQAFYVDPGNPAAQQIRAWKAAGRADDADALQRIAKQPTATWFTGAPTVHAEVRALTIRAQKTHRRALLVAYDIPGRDCGSYSAGGAASAGAYRAWIDAFASGIGPRTATVILEPDAIAQALSGCVPASAQASRYALLAYAIHALRERRHVTVYLDAGNVGWITDPTQLVAPLRAA